MTTVMLHGHNHTRPGIFPLEWYGVTQWRTSRKDALEDLYRAERCHNVIYKRIPEPMIQHKIEVCEVKVDSGGGA